MTEPDWLEPESEPEAAVGSTGNAAVDATVEALGDVASLAPREQVAAYTEAHQALQETLQTIEEH